MLKKRYLKNFIKGPAHIFYHVALIALSASIALSLPYTAEFLSSNFLNFRAVINNDKMFLLSLEICLAIALILFFNYIAGSLRDRRISSLAREAGLAHISSVKGFFALRKNRRLKESNGIARDVSIIGSTGFTTFVDEKGDLHNVIKNCRSAKIMLLNPYSEGASIRAKSILDPDITAERLGAQIGKGIEFLKELSAAQKNIRLKLYNEVPFLKMAISGDYMWIKHYHTGFDVKGMPEYVFRYDQNPGSLYAVFYQHFLKWWNNPAIPEYDLESDELIYRDIAGNEERREYFNRLEEDTGSDRREGASGREGIILVNRYKAGWDTIQSLRLTSGIAKMKYEQLKNLSAYVGQTIKRHFRFLERPIQK